MLTLFIPAPERHRTGIFKKSATLVALSIFSLGIMPPLQAQAGSCTVADRTRTHSEFRTLYLDGRINEGLQLLRGLVERHCSSVEDLVIIAATHSQIGEHAESERWYRKAIKLLETENRFFRDNLQFYLGMEMMRQGHDTAAVPILTAATEHPQFRTWTSFDNWEETSSDVGFAESEVEELLHISRMLDESGASSTAEMYRRAAATGALKRGLLAIRSHEPNLALRQFAMAEDVVTLTDFSIPVQMTVLRDVALAHSRLGEFQHSMAAIQTLFTLCRPMDDQFACPWQGVASSPFPIVFDPDSVDSGTLLMQQHLNILSKVLERAFISISWDPLTGHRRANASVHDFVGIIAHDGQAYGGAVSGEEDRVEYLRVWMSENTDVFQAHVLQMMRDSSRAEPLVKLLLAELMFHPMLGVQLYPEVVTSDRFLGLPIQTIEYELESLRQRSPEAVADHTWEAFQVALQAIEILREVSTSPTQ